MAVCQLALGTATGFCYIFTVILLISVRPLQSHSIERDVNAVIMEVVTVSTVQFAMTSTLTLEDGADMLSRNVGNYQSTLRNFPEELRSYFMVSPQLFQADGPGIAHSV